MNATTLIAMSVTPITQRLKLWGMKRKLRSLNRLADHFDAQSMNARFGQADTQKRIIFLQSEIRQMERTIQ